MIIRVDPQELKNQSNQVAADIRSIEKHWKGIANIVSGSKNYWEGDASNTHQRIYKDLADDAEKIIQRMKENPIKLQQMAGIYGDTQETATKQASELPADIF